METIPTKDVFACLTCDETNFFRNILDSMPYRIWMQDMQGNTVWENLLSKQEPYKVTGDCDKLTKELVKARQGESGVVECRKLATNGEHTWVRVNYHPVYDHNGEQVGVYGIEKDITLQKEALPRLLKIKASYDAQLTLKEV